MPPSSLEQDHDSVVVLHGVGHDILFGHDEKPLIIDQIDDRDIHLCGNLEGTSSLGSARRDLRDPDQDFLLPPPHATFARTPWLSSHPTSSLPFSSAF